VIELLVNIREDAGEVVSVGGVEGIRPLALEALISRCGKASTRNAARSRWATQTVRWPPAVATSKKGNGPGWGRCCLQLDRREFAAQLKERGWTYDERLHLWQRSGEREETSDDLLLPLD
jgi:hypothetical protein